MTEGVKIKCDDCKFVEDCVDYGWQDCKKFTPKPSEPMTKLCDTCEYLKFCARSGIEDVGCDRYKRDTTTNEEWFCSLSTEEKAKFIFWQHFDVYGKTLWELMVNASKGVARDKQAEVMIGAVVEWLKEIRK